MWAVRNDQEAELIQPIGESSPQCFIQLLWQNGSNTDLEQRSSLLLDIGCLCTAAFQERKLGKVRLLPGHYWGRVPFSRMLQRWFHHVGQHSLLFNQSNVVPVRWCQTTNPPNPRQHGQQTGMDGSCSPTTCGRHHIPLVK